MKTIDLLVQELPALGGFPDGAVEAGFLCSDDTLYFVNKDGDCPSEWRISMKYDVEDRWVKVTREQYEAALSAKNDGWIEWGGGECPVPGDTEVLIKCKSEGAWDYRRKQRADEVSCTHDDLVLDVIAYQLHQPQQAEQPEAIEEDLNECIGQAPAPVWNGGWLPSAGCECEYQYKVHGSEWCGFECVAVDGNAAFGWSNNTPIALQLNTHNFRPMRSKAERKRDDAKHAIAELCRSSASNGHSADLIYDAIAAGKIPGVKLED